MFELIRKDRCRDGSQKGITMHFWFICNQNTFDKYGFLWQGVHLLIYVYLLL